MVRKARAKRSEAVISSQGGAAAEPPPRFCSATRFTTAGTAIAWPVRMRRRGSYKWGYRWGNKWKEQRMVIPTESDGIVIAVHFVRHLGKL